MVLVGVIIVMFVSSSVTSNMLLRTPYLEKQQNCSNRQECYARMTNLSTDDVLVSQPFDYASLESGFACESGNSFMISEDFSVTGNVSVDELEIWMIYSSGTPVAQYTLGFQGDAGNDPDGIFIWQDVETDISNANTGLSAWGYDIWYTHVTITDGPVLSGPEVYWFCLQAESVPAVYWLGPANPTGWGSMFYMSLDDGVTWESSVAQFGAPYATFFYPSGNDVVGTILLG